MSKIIYSPSVEGHYLEYINHIFNKCVKHPSTNYVFVLPSKFNSLKDRLDWTPKSEHIIFEILSDDEERQINHNSQLVRSYYTARILRKKAITHNADSIFSTLLIGTLPFLSFILPKNIKVSGIIYMIYLYRYANSSLSFKLQSLLKYFLLSKSKIYDTVYILNDKESANRLNNIYKTNKFNELPDPYIPLCNNNDIQIRQSLNIQENNKLFIHIGAMNENKGTLNLLKSLQYLEPSDSENMTFILAGKVEDDIKKEFYEILNTLMEHVKVHVIDQFCEYLYFSSLCSACDAIIIPYQRTSQSSGIIGYASQFRKPVIAPKDGLLGHLVKSYKLGILIQDTTPITLINSYRKVINGEFEVPPSDYCRCHTIEIFQNTIDAVL